MTIQANEHAIRAGFNLRVSSEEQVEGYRLSAQERAIDAYCQAHEYQVVACYRDEGKSARTDNLANRPAFKQMLADAESGRFDVLIVHKLDRFARNLRLTLETLDRMDRAGVGFVSVSENMDFATPMGRVILSTMGSLAQFYSDNLSFETKKGKHERKQQGLHNGLLPFGTVRSPRGLPTLDSQVRYCDVSIRREIVPAAGLVLAFEHAAAGKTDREIAQALNIRGYRTSGNRGMNPFTKDTVRAILRNRFYVGDLPDGEGGWVAGRHGSLIDTALFEAAQRAREANTKKPRRVPGLRSPWALSGVATCAECGESIIIHGRPDGRSRLRCSGRAQGNGCGQPSFFADEAEEQVINFLDGFAVPVEKRDRFLNAWRMHQSASIDIAAQRLRLRRKLDRLREVYLEGDLDKAAYQTQKAAISDSLTSLPTGGDPDNGAGERLANFLADVSAAWRVATSGERNRLAHLLFSQAVIENKTVVAVVPRPELVPFFDVVKRGYGGSDGGRIRTFRTSRAGNVGCQSWTSAWVPQPLLAGHRRVTLPHPPGIAGALAG